MTPKQVKAKLKNLGLINEDGTPVLYSKFKNKATVVAYNRKKVIYLGVPNSNLFAFYPKQAGSDSIVLKNAYQNFRQLVKGKITPITEGEVKWAKTAIPSTYSSFNK